MSQDREFETYLQGETDLSQLYADLPQMKTPDHLDAAILAEAHRAVNARPGVAPKRSLVIPLSMVASLFVAVLIGLQLPYWLQDASRPQLAHEGRVVAAPDKITTKPSLPAADERTRMQVAVKEKSEITGSEVFTSAAETYAGPKMPETTLLMAAIAPKQMDLKESADVGNEVMLFNEASQSRFAVGNVIKSPEQTASAAVRMLAPQMDQPVNAFASTDASSQSPENWLVRIKKLKREGKFEEAKKNLAAFKERYPDYPVPVDVLEK